MLFLWDRQQKQILSCKLIKNSSDPLLHTEQKQPVRIQAIDFFQINVNKIIRFTKYLLPCRVCFNKPQVMLSDDFEKGHNLLPFSKTFFSNIHIFTESDQNRAPNYLLVFNQYLQDNHFSFLSKTALLKTEHAQTAPLSRHCLRSFSCQKCMKN